MSRSPSELVATVELGNVQRSLLESLLERMRLDPRLRGLVSPMEVEALGDVLEPTPRPTLPANGKITESKPKVASPPGAPSARRRLPPGPRPTAKLDLEALEVAAEDELMLCLDFGTATSKVGLVRCGREVLPLALGSSPDAFTVEASLFAEDDMLHIGPAAVTTSLAQRRPRMDSLKRVLGRLPLGRNPETTALTDLGVAGAPSQLSLAEAMVSILTWLTHRARSAASSQHGLEGRLMRRFALPCWPSARWLSLKPIIARWMAEAEILADSLASSLDENVISQSDVRSLRQRLHVLPRLPENLIGRAVSEPVAAAASRFGPDAVTRGLVLVVDMGAGTTDLAVFVVDAQPEAARFEILPIEGATDVLGRAGDTVDRALREVMQSRIQSLPRRLRRPLPHSLRREKERLLIEGNLEIEGHPAQTISRDELLSHPNVASFEPLLRERIRQLLARIPASALKRWSDGQLYVCLTGGGAHLPMVSRLVHGATKVHGVNLEHRPGPELPPFLRQYPELRAAYARLAVALGGASGYLPREGRCFALAGTTKDLDEELRTAKSRSCHLSTEGGRSLGAVEEHPLGSGSSGHDRSLRS